MYEAYKKKFYLRHEKQKDKDDKNLIKNYKMLLDQLDSLVESHEKSFAKNLTDKELELLNELLEKFRN